MLRRRGKHLDKAQSLVEYSVVLGIVVLIMTAMTPFIRRSMQGAIRLVADQVGNQLEADQDYVTNEGFMEYSNTGSRLQQEKTVMEDLGDTTIRYNSVTTSQGNVLVNLGLTEVR